MAPPPPTSGIPGISTRLEVLAVAAGVDRDAEHGGARTSEEDEPDAEAGQPRSEPAPHGADLPITALMGPDTAWDALNASLCEEGDRLCHEETTPARAAAAYARAARKAS